MSTPDKRFTIVFNGEVYNFADLRKELVTGGAEFTSNSDTEVVLRLFQRDGADCVRSLDGMFAFAIYDAEARSCFLARDPMGIKPLYVWQVGGQLAFASEIRSVLKAKLGPTRLCQQGLARYLLHGSVQEPGTLIEGIQALPAGHTMTWQAGGSAALSSQQYWNIEFAADPISRQDAAQLTRQALDESIRRHFVSDVPVGVFLSGGIDSTALVALARAAGYEDLQTFCIGFKEADFDESGLADQTAKHFGTNHHRWQMTASDGIGLVDDFLKGIDQPSNDGFNTYCVSKFARDAGLKVVLSGLGGDELFGGYPSFEKVPKLARWGRRTRWLPMRGAISKFGQSARFPSKVRRLSALLGSPGDHSSAYWTMRGFFTPREIDALVKAYTGDDYSGRVSDLLGATMPSQPTEKDRVSYLEMTRYMRNQLLRDSDVMSMAHGLELRVPLVDRKLVDTISRIPSAVRHASGKRLVLDAVPEIPDWIANQPKRGFRFPFDQWIISEWGDVFDSIAHWSPVPMEHWYRSWALFTLNHFLQENEIAAAGLSFPC
jgi:asparagine synthase (glutamine-hydrolysing)